MKRTLYFAILVLLAASSNAQALRGIADVTIIDRDSGAALSPHYYRGEYWVAGRPGAHYAIEIRNRLGERLLAVTSVDGVNVVSGGTAGWEQTGYVFSPGERYQITGWRKTDTEVAAFTFIDSPNSYAERTGRPANVGVIGVAVFRERQPEPVEVPPMIGQSPANPEPPHTPDAAPKQTAESTAKIPADSPMSASPAQRAVASAATAPAQRSASMAAPAQSQISATPAPAPKLGTGHGERQYSYVSHTEFQRLQTQPNEIIRIHYDSLDNLFAMGILKRLRPAPPGTNPFPASPDRDYVPDPPGPG